MTLPQGLKKALRYIIWPINWIGRFFDDSHEFTFKRFLIQMVIVAGIAASVAVPVVLYVTHVPDESTVCLQQLVASEAVRELYFKDDPTERKRLLWIAYTKFAQTAEGKSGDFFETMCGNVHATMPTLKVPYTGARWRPGDPDLWTYAGKIVWDARWRLFGENAPPVCVRWYSHDTWQSMARGAWHSSMKGRIHVATVGKSHFYCRYGVKGKDIPKAQPKKG